MRIAGIVFAAFALCVFGFALLSHTDSAKARIARSIEAYLQREYAIPSQIGQLNYRFFPVRVELFNTSIFSDITKKHLAVRFSDLQLAIPYSIFWQRELHIDSVDAVISSVDFAKLPHIAWRKLAEEKIRVDHLRVRGSMFRYLNAGLDDVLIDAAAMRDRLLIRTVTARSGSMRLKAGGGYFPLESKGTLAYQIEGDASDLANIVNQPFVRTIHGAFKSSGRLNTVGQKFLLQGQVSADSLFAGKAPSLFGLRAAFRADSSKAITVDANLRRLLLSEFLRVGSVAQGSIRYSGGIDPKQGFLTFDFVLSPSGQGEVQASGPLCGSFHDGTLRLLPAKLQLRSRSPASGISLRLNYAAYDFIHSNGSVDLQAEGSSRGTGFAGHVLANGSVNHISASIEHAVLQRNQFQLSIEKSDVELKNSMLSLNLHGNVADGSYVLKGLLPLNESAAMKLDASAKVDAESISRFFPRTQATGSLTVLASVKGTRKAPHFHVAIQGNDLTLHLPQNLEAQHAVVNLRVEGTSRNPANWKGDASFSAAKWRLQDKDLGQIAPFHFQAANGFLSMKQVDLSIADFGVLQAGGAINLANGALNFRVDSSAELKNVSRYYPNIDAAGKLQASLQIGGSLLSPRMNGSLSLHNGALQTSSVPYNIDGVNVDGSFHGDRISIDRVSGKIAGGSLSGGGTLQLANGKFLPQLWLSAHGLGIEYLDDVRSGVDADLHLSAADGRPFLSGQLTLSRCIVTRNITPKERSNVSWLLARYALSSLKSKVPFPADIQVRSNDPISISNNLGRIQADVNLRIKADSEAPRISGGLNVRNTSKLFLQTRVFSVQRGKIEFDGSEKPVPHLDLILTSTIPDDQTKRVYQVRLPLRGAMDNLEDVPPNSTPSLLPQQIYFLLLTGRTEAQLTQSEASFMRKQLLAYYSVQSVLPVPEKLPIDQNLNSVEIRPEAISSERDPGKNMINGKNYFSGVSLVYSLPLTQPDEQMWIANYRARKNLALRIIDHVDGSYSSTVEQRFHFGGSRSVSAPPETKQAQQSFGQKNSSIGAAGSTGFSGLTTADNGILQQQILRALWLEGYHQAQVDVSEKNGQSTFAIRRGSQFTNAILQWEGVNYFTPSQLRKELVSIAGSEKEFESKALHDFAWLQGAIAIAYAKQGFYDATAREEVSKFDPSRGTVSKTILIQEGSRSMVKDIRTSENQPLPQDLMKQLKQQANRTYNPDDVAEDELTIAHFYESRGYRNVRVNSDVFRDRDALLLSYELATGGVARIAKVEIRGAASVPQDSVKRMLPFKAGDTLVQEQIAQAQKRLSDSGLFHDVRVQAIETPIPNRYNVEIQVREAAPYEVAYSIGYNTEKKAEGTVQFSDRNFLQTGGTASFLAKLNSQDRVARLLYDVPDFSGLKWQTLVSASYERFEQPLFVTSTQSLEAQRQLNLLHPFALVVGYRFDRVRVTEKNPSDIRYPGESPVNLSRVETALLFDSRSDPISPMHGQFLSVQTSLAPTFLGSGLSFVKNYSQFYRYQSFGKMVWASGLRLGFAKSFGEDLIATERFFAGGSFSLRGFDRDSIGPRDPIHDIPVGGEAVLILNEELRFPLPIHPWLGGAVFYDGGNVYDHVSDFNPFHLRHSAGFGLRFNTPVGVARFDWGFNLNRRPGEKRSVFHIALGQAF